MSWRALAGQRVFPDRDLESAGGFNDGEDCGNTWSGLLVSDVGPVATANRHRAHGVLGEVVAQLQFCIVEEAREFFLQPKSVGRCLAEWTRWEVPFGWQPRSAP
jgi:hypothetical protein